MSTRRFTPFPVLTTSRFLLRPLTQEDAASIFVLRTDDAVNQFLDRPKARTMDDVRQFITRIADGIEQDAAIFWVIEYCDGNGFAGTVCMWNISWADARAEIGYELLPQHQGKGIMQEVIPVILEYAFGPLGLRCIVAELSEKNVRSVRLLEKSGFVRHTFTANEEGLVFYRLEK